MIATAPGKLILTGEYAVLDGAPALVIAVDRRVVASRRPAAAIASSPFLLAVAAELATRRGTHDRAACAAGEISVDSSAFHTGMTKLGLGSSAAVTVAATALALGEAAIAERGPHDANLTLDRAEVLAIASAAHAAAQAPLGARGSGADIAAVVTGGTIVFTANRIARRRWPDQVQLVSFFTGAAANTAELVARVAAARTADRTAVDAALRAIADASGSVCAALAAPPELIATMLIDAFASAGRATDQLAHATRLDLVPMCVTAARSAMQRLGGTAKTTGAGGGDIGIAVIPHTADATIATDLLIQCGCQPLQLTVDESGVDLRSVAS